MEIQIGNTQLRVHKNGQIERFGKQTKKWKFVKGTDKCGYLTLGIDYKIYFIHRIIAHAYIGLELESETNIDHIDRNKSNNHVDNLRLVTQQENNLNKEQTGYAKGYTITPYGTYYVQITINGKQVSFGTYKTEYDAIRRFTYESEKIGRLRML